MNDYKIEVSTKANHTRKPLILLGQAVFSQDNSQGMPSRHPGSVLEPLEAPHLPSSGSTLSARTPGGSSPPGSCDTHESRYLARLEYHV